MVLFINSFSRAVKNQCALHCKQFIMMGDGRRAVELRGEEEKRGGGKKLNCNRIDLFKYNNVALCSGSGGEEERKRRRKRRQRRPDKD